MSRIKNYLLSRLAYFPFYLAKFILLFSFSKKTDHAKESNALFCIEAGEKGWESIEFKEIYQSAVEFIGNDKVLKLTIKRDADYISQVKDFIGCNKITHYLYDPRTGSQDFFTGLKQSFYMAFLLHSYRIIPIVLLTDLSVRTWRSQSAVVSAKSGIVITFMSPQKIQPIFPHRRLVGPSLMPFSNNTLNKLKLLKEANSHQQYFVVRFTGSLYEPRTTFLNHVNKILKNSNQELEILGRTLGSTRVTDDEYWNRLSSALIIITTADQMQQEGTDWTWIPHLVYRYLEVLAAGSLLMAPVVPCLARYFIPDIHFVSFTTAENAAEKASYYLNHPDEARKIAAAGHDKATHLIRSHLFWIQIETGLACQLILS